MPENATALNAQNLPEIGTRVPVPGYDRSAVTAGVVHFGVGGFHRAHQAAYLDRLLAEDFEAAKDYGICGVGVLPGDARMRDTMAAQDRLYTLVLKHPDGSLEPRVIGSVVEYLFAPDDPEAVVEKLAAPTTRIVSLTVTEGGYNLDDITGEFVTDTPAVAADAAAGPDAGKLTTVFGLVVEALVRRRERGLDPFTVMSCDNLQGNGHLAQTAFAAFAELREEALGEWVREHVRFPNSMVDRITPATTGDDVALVEREFGVADSWPVVCEPFTQWALEDAFGAGRPPLEEVGVQVVPDVEPYELMKLRLLNASHQALAYFGRLLDHELVDGAATDPDLKPFVRAYMDAEATPTLAPVPGVDLEEYKDTLEERFGNPHVRDTTARLAAESSDRIPKWLVPVVRANLAAGRDVHRAAAVVASWARYAEGVDEHGEPITVVDRRRERVQEAAQRQLGGDGAEGGDPLAFVRDRELFGDLADDERFTAAYLDALRGLHEHGARATLQRLQRGEPS
ncbi:mannitol dehydrogenase family protein [Quadrisphaera setariae]|uniref:Mannitol-1-phosphate 5-dehydrogenase n=1 Tax=Quadrisphaera setariae TaxID=2593304 RepID=A0A5C8ZCM3_9ACTN|nr:mannitol dehydrogenase family protein [Quadrisphaera setariae]TXR55029.1 mannitol dehydrogenase family protein [Quadrisphaera setariae]